MITANLKCFNCFLKNFESGLDLKVDQAAATAYCCCIYWTSKSGGGSLMWLVEQHNDQKRVLIG